MYGDTSEQCTALRTKAGQRKSVASKPAGIKQKQSCGSDRTSVYRTVCPHVTFVHIRVILRFATSTNPRSIISADSPPCAREELQKHGRQRRNHAIRQYDEHLQHFQRAIGHIELDITYHNGAHHPRHLQSDVELESPESSKRV